MIQQVCNRGPADAGPGSMCTTTLSQKKKKKSETNSEIDVLCATQTQRQRGLTSYIFWGRNHSTDLQLQSHSVCVCVFGGEGGELQVYIILKFLYVHLEES